MSIFYKKYILILIAFCLFSGKGIFAQSAMVAATVDSNEILIGGQFHLIITATLPDNVIKIGWPTMPDSLQHFEVLDKGKQDSVFTDNRLTAISQTFTFTSFDSGKWIIPPFKIELTTGSSTTPIKLVTDAIPITVSFSVADTTSQLKDIKSVYIVADKVPVWYWIVGALGLLVIVVLVFLGYRYWKKKKPVKAISKLAAFEIAMKSLNSLQQYNLSLPADVKAFHVDLVDIFRKYLTAISNINQLNKTTSDIIIQLNNYSIGKDAVALTAAALRSADAVKFAKYIPDQESAVANKLALKDTIQLLNKKLTTTNSM